MLSKKPTRPPTLALVADQRIPGVEGSYVWSGRAVDRLLQVPPERTVVRGGEILRFEGDGPPSDEAFLWAYPLSDGKHAKLLPAWEGPLDPHRLAWRVDLAPGDYVVAIFRVWTRHGDVTHYFALKVIPAASGE